MPPTPHAHKTFPRRWERRLRSLVRTELEKQWLQTSGSDRAVAIAGSAEHGLLSDDAGCC